MSIATVEARFAPSEDWKAAIARRGMVATAHPEATAIGANILAEGGNAADAAAAIGLALGVCEPAGSGLGGQTIALAHIDGRTFALDGSSRVPSRAILDNLDADDRRLGHQAATVPSTPATLAWLHKTHGRLPWHVVVEPAAALARRGYPISPLQSSLQERSCDAFLAVPGQAGARYFLRCDLTPHEPGDVFRQPDLAACLDTLAERGVEDFYQGDIAAQVHHDMRTHDGYLRADDLALIPWPIERKPLRRRYRKLTIHTMPPPGAGRILLLVLMLLAHLPPKRISHPTPPLYHYLAEAMRKAFLHRLDRPFDRHTYPQLPDKPLLNRDFVSGLAATIADGIDSSLPLVDPPGEETEETTHFSVADADGNMVAATASVELVYGSKAAAEGLGFLYNNYLGACDTTDPSHPYYLRPGAVPWSSACPSIVFANNRPWIACGTPGSERIFSTLSQFISHVADRDASIDEAMRRPRIHCSMGGRVSCEADRFDPAILAYLASNGYRIDPRPPWAFYLGSVQAVLACQTYDAFQGIADVRRDGTARGPDK